MDNDKTVIMRLQPGGSPGASRIRITYPIGGGQSNNVEFSRAFTIGRLGSCDVSIDDDGVSRRHAEVYPTTQGWFIRDLGSANGTLLDDRLIQKVILTGKSTIQLGHGGPQLWLEPLTTHSTPIQPAHTDAEPPTEDALYDKYLSDNPTDEMGDHTYMVRQVIRKAQKKQSYRYHLIVSTIGLLLLAMIGLAVYQQSRLYKSRSLAVDMFYDMKTLEVQIARTETQLQRAGTLTQLADTARKRERLEEMERRYRDYLEEIEAIPLFKKRRSSEDELILKVARVFGECELELPEGFVTEVKKYIARWKGSPRMARALARLDEFGFKPSVLNALASQQLPPQFLYLAMQESNFRYDAIGPKTRWGIAKGAWQFIPSTATEYGLKIGPLSPLREYDPEDERFDFEKASKAAARYLKYIYSMEAQASGLLVMASYNWGHNRVRRLIRSMPDNPRERNFWQLIKKYRIPKETYDYVFYIFSAAVIGEDPKRFGFDFHNPIAKTSAID